MVRPQVLYVEDDELLRTVTTMALEDAGFEVVQRGACLRDDGFRQAGERGHLQAEAAVGGAVFHRVHEHEPLAVLDGVEMHVGEVGVFVGEQREFKVMRGKQRQRAVLFDEVAADGEG